MIEDWHESTVGSNRFEFSLNKVPFKWKCGREIDMHYYGGMIGVSIASDSALTAVFGYAIAEDRTADDYEEGESKLKPV